MSELLELQMLHVELTARLISYGKLNGYRFKWGQTLRTQAEADANAASGAGIRNSLHLLGLAVDLSLFKNGVYLTASEDYQFLGNYWKSMHVLARWGGDFRPRPDGNHFSLEYQGVK